MTAKIIVVSNQKGGCGKTTISMNLAYFLGKLYPEMVLVIDGDPQASALKWATDADEDKPFPCPVINLSSTVDKVHNEIKKHINKYKFIIVDCPPSVSSNFTASALIVAHLNLITIKPSPIDISASVPFEKLVQNIQNSINENLKAYFVINELRYGESIGKDVIEALNNFEIKPLRTQVHQRTSYRHSALGSSVLDGKDEKAISEINRLGKEVLGLL
jgi:chromosome partitioning protein